MFKGLLILFFIVAFRVVAAAYDQDCESEELLSIGEELSLDIVFVLQEVDAQFEFVLNFAEALNYTDVVGSYGIITYGALNGSVAVNTTGNFSIVESYLLSSSHSAEVPERSCAGFGIEKAITLLEEHSSRDVLGTLIILLGNGRNCDVADNLIYVSDYAKSKLHTWLLTIGIGTEVIASANDDVKTAWNAINIDSLWSTIAVEAACSATLAGRILSDIKVLCQISRDKKPLSWIYENFDPCNVSALSPAQVNGITIDSGRVVSLDLGACSMSGTIPEYIGALNTLQELFLDNNHLTGVVPDALCTLHLLESLQLQKNELSGYLPSCIRNMSHLVECLLYGAENSILCDTFTSSVCTSGCHFVSSGSSPDQAWLYIVAAFAIFGGLAFVGGSAVAFVFLARNCNRFRLRIRDHDDTSADATGTDSKADDLIFPTEDGSILGLHFSKTELDFKTSEQPCHVDIPVSDSVTITNSRKQTRLLRFYPPSNRKLKLSCPKQIVVFPGSERVVFFEAIMLCTAKVRESIAVEVQSVGKTEFALSIVSGPSCKIDSDDVRMGSLLGSGGAALVYKGQWIGTDVAVKVFHFPPEEGFVQELAILQSLRSPFIATYFGSTIMRDGRFAIILEYIAMGSLSSVLQKFVVSPRLKIRMALEVAMGMNFLHQQNVLHRDLKADNVLMITMHYEAPQHIKLSDFGTARLAGEEQRQLTKGVGTLIYMAPEVLCGLAYNKTADIYSYGMFLWQLFSASEPYFNFESIWAIQEFVLQGDRLEMPDDLGKGPVEDLLAKCWAQEQERRPSFATIVPVLQQADLSASL